jgi:molybdopterin-synthase adenylyltransferase
LQLWKRLSTAHRVLTMTREQILIVGAGGLGVPAAWALAREGAAFTIIDPDPIELSNLPRQVIYTEADIGRSKVETAQDFLRARFQNVDITARAIALDEANAAQLVASHALVIDATDSPLAKFLINDTCLRLGRPFVYAGVIGMTGQAMTVLPAKTACLRCLFEEPPGEAEIASCRDAGIIGPVAGALGEIEADEALRVGRGRESRLAGKILAYDGASAPRVRVTPVRARKGCGCGADAAVANPDQRGTKEHDELHH